MLAAGVRDLIGGTLAAAAAVAIALMPIGGDGLPVTLAVAALAAWIALQDLADFTIPDGAVLGLALIAAALRLRAVSDGLIGVEDALVIAAFDLAVCGGGLWSVREVFYRRRGFDGLGFGDVKLGAAGGLLVGTSGFSMALVAASLAGVVVLIVRHGRAPDLRTARLAFGALLAPAVALVHALAPDLAVGGLP